jgi:hypothetical protein
MDTPSWLQLVPYNFGSAAAGSLKADEWRTMTTVYIPVALVSLWGEGMKHPSEKSASTLRIALDLRLSASALASYSHSDSRVFWTQKSILALTQVFACEYSQLTSQVLAYSQVLVSLRVLWLGFHNTQVFTSTCKYTYKYS